MLGMLEKQIKIWSWHDAKDSIRLLEFPAKKKQQAPHVILCTFMKQVR